MMRGMRPPARTSGEGEGEDVDRRVGARVPPENERMRKGAHLVVKTGIGRVGGRRLGLGLELGRAPRQRGLASSLIGLTTWGRGQQEGEGRGLRREGGAG